MRRFLTLLCAASASVLFIGGGTSSAQNGSQGAENLVAGTGTLVCCGEPMVHVNAQSREGGVDPRGHFWIRYPNDGGEFGGRVVCLDVTGNVAGLIGHIERVKVPRPVSNFFLGNYLIIEITDMGSPGTLDLVNFHPGTSTNPGVCPPGANLILSQGNYVVHDKPVLNFSALDLLLAQFEAEANHP